MIGAMQHAPTPLEEILKNRIAQSGPLTVADYMEICLSDPDHGYYRTRDPLGRHGDFITAPEISQIFGELIGLWCADVWRSMGKPRPCQIIELGPGRGTLMADTLRAAKVVPEFIEAARIHLVETSPVLTRQQEEQLRAYEPQWHEALASVPAGPSIVIANEFLDALPVRQFVRLLDGWRERCVTAGADGALAFTEGPELPPGKCPVPSEITSAAATGAFAEIRPAANALAMELGARAEGHPLAVLIIDYGHVRSAPGETLQAMSAHGYADPLERPGEQDLTAHVDFAEFARHAANAGLRVHGPLEQGRFLLELGLAHRAEQLMKGAPVQQTDATQAAARRLVDPEQMGTLFKVLALSSAGLPAPPPFREPGQEKVQEPEC